MKVRHFEDREAWLVARLGKATGSKLKEIINLRDGGTKPGVWQLAAESFIGAAAIAEQEESRETAMARGNRLEPIALARFAAETGKKVDTSLVLWERDDDSRIAVSPDGFIGKTAAVEVKCLGSAKHIEAMYTRAIPKNTAGYEEQMLQYFIVNEKLTKLFYVFYDDRFPAPMDFFYLTFTRKGLQPKIDEYLALERAAVAKVREIVNAVSLYSPDQVASVEARSKELLSSNEPNV